METNFFEQIAGLQITGNLQINIQCNDIGTLAVTILLANQNPKITKGKNIPPMLLKGKPQELDEAFFRQISEPVKQTIKLFSNLEAYQAELDKAKKQPEKTTGKPSATPAKKADNSLFTQPAEEPETETDDDLDEQPDETENLVEKQRLYDEAMQRVAQLNTDMKYKEAIAQLPDAEEYPEKAEELKTKREQLEKRLALYNSLQEV